MRRLLAALQKARRASAAVEFGLIAPTMALMAGGVFELGSLLQADAAVNRLAMQYAISFADCSDTAAGVCGTELNLYTSTTTIGYVAPQLTASNVTVSMAQVSVTNGTQTVTYPTGGSLTTAQASAVQNAVPTLGTGQTGVAVAVTVTYTYQLLIFSTLMAPVIGSSFNLSYTVAQLK